MRDPVDEPDVEGVGDSADEAFAVPPSHRVVQLLLVIGGPFALLLGIATSLWVHGWALTHSAIVHADEALVGGRAIVVRVSVTPEAGRTVTSVRGDVVLEGTRAELQDVGVHGLAQAELVVPPGPAGPLALELDLRPEGLPETHETIAVERVDVATVLAPTAIQSSSMAQYADDSEPQPSNLRIVVRDAPRLVTGFADTLWVRITYPDGRPWSGPLDVALVYGEWNRQVGRPDDSVVVAQGHTDALGLFAFEGTLTTEVLRVRVRARSSVDENTVVASRRVRLVTYAGAVVLDAPPTARPGTPIEVSARGLSTQRPTFVDIHAPDGGWIGTVSPPFRGAEPPRELVLPDAGPGTYQLEAYQYTTAPGETTAIARVHVAAPDADPSVVSAELVSAQRDRLDQRGTELGYDHALERAWLDGLATHAHTPDLVATAERFLVDTLPPRVFGPPVVLSTRERDVTALAEIKARWAMGLRVYFLLGGGMFLALLTGLMIRSHTRAARRALAGIERLGQDVDVASEAAEITAARRAALGRGLVLVAVMAGGIVMTVLLLEKLLWAV